MICESCSISSQFFVGLLVITLVSTLVWVPKPDSHIYNFSLDFEALPRTLEGSCLSCGGSSCSLRNVYSILELKTFGICIYLLNFVFTLVALICDNQILGWLQNEQVLLLCIVLALSLCSIFFVELRMTCLGGNIKVSSFLFLGRDNFPHNQYISYTISYLCLHCLIMQGLALFLFTLVARCLLDHSKTW